MRTMKSIFIGMLIFSNGFSLAATTSDTINIKQIFSKPDGTFAMQGEGALANASADRDCLPGAVWDKSWTGLDADASERIIAVILSAHGQGKPLKVQTDGCIGPWHKITSIYLGQ